MAGRGVFPLSRPSFLFIILPFIQSFIRLLSNSVIFYNFTEWTYRETQRETVTDDNADFNRGIICSRIDR